MARQIPLSRGLVALVSDEDYERVSRHKWSYHNAGYACRKARITLPNGRVVRRTVLLHRFLLDAPAHMDVDHIDGDGLNCQRNNLRIATRSQNVANSGTRGKSNCRYKGVFYRANRRKWRAEITVNRHKRYLGQFPTDIEAAKAYDLAAFAAWGEFARLNFPELRPVYALSLALAAATARASSN